MFTVKTLKLVIFTDFYFYFTEKQFVHIAKYRIVSWNSFVVLTTCICIFYDVKFDIGYDFSVIENSVLKNSIYWTDIFKRFTKRSLIPQKSFPNGPLVKIDSESSAKKIFLRASKALQYQMPNLLWSGISFTTTRKIGERTERQVANFPSLGDQIFVCKIAKKIQ